MSTSCIIRELNWSRCLSRTSRWLLELWEYYLDYSVCLERAFGFFNFNEATGLALESSFVIRGPAAFRCPGRRDYGIIS